MPLIGEGQAPKPQGQVDFILIDLVNREDPDGTVVFEAYVYSHIPIALPAPSTTTVLSTSSRAICPESIA